MNFRDRYGVSDFMIKRIRRTVVPFLAWSTITYVMLFFLGHIPEESNFLLSVINCSHFSIYWFFIPLFACYLSIPVLSLVENKVKIFSYLAAYAFVSYSVIPFIESYFGIVINHGIQAPIGGGYVLYLLLGYLLGTIDLDRNKRLVIYSLGVFGWALHCVMTIVLSPDGGNINMLFKGYLNFPCVLHSCAIFVYCKYTNWEWIYRRKWVSYAFNKIKECGLGVYLIHGIFVYYVVPYLGIRTASMVYRTVGALIIVILSVAMTMAIKRIPVLKNIVP